MKMRIADIFDERMSFSFEVFPPKADQPMEPLLDVMNKLYGFKPDFISCTYGAGGSNKGRNTEVCGAIKKSDVECMTHFTCIGNTKADIKTYLKEYLDAGIFPQLKGKTLKEGFIWKNLTPKEKMQLQEVLENYILSLDAKK